MSTLIQLKITFANAILVTLVICAKATLMNAIRILVRIMAHVKTWPMAIHALARASMLEAIVK